MDQKTNIVKKLIAFKKGMDKKFPVRKIFLFGSRASGTPHKDSDIDLIVVSSKFGKLNFFKRCAKMYHFWNLDYAVDFLCYTPEEFEIKKKQVGIVQEAVREGIEIK